MLDALPLLLPSGHKELEDMVQLLVAVGSHFHLGTGGRAGHRPKTTLRSTLAMPTSQGQRGLVLPKMSAGQRD